MPRSELAAIREILAARRLNRRSVLAGSAAAGLAAAVGAPHEAGAVCSTTSIDNSQSSISACSPGQKCCFGLCKNVSYDPANCGDCGHRCGYGQTCAGGVCSGGSGGGSQPVLQGPAAGVYQSRLNWSLRWAPVDWSFFAEQPTEWYEELFSLEHRLTSGVIQVRVGGSSVYADATTPARDRIDWLNAQSEVTDLALMPDSAGNGLEQYDAGDGYPWHWIVFQYAETSATYSFPLPAAEVWFSRVTIPDAALVTLMMKVYLSSNVYDQNLFANQYRWYERLLGGLAIPR